MLKIFIGYDTKEPIAYHVLSHSIIKRSTKPVSIIPLAKHHLNGIYTRERSPIESTEFSLTRFLVPYLSDYTGLSIFMDCDILCLVDINKILDELWYPKALWVCKHDYQPKTVNKFLGQVQTSYKCKNWSSFMVFNNGLCKALTPEYVNNASGLELHQFKWVDEKMIGELPLEWNWLVGEYEDNENANMLHYTIGGPWFDTYNKGNCADKWFNERDNLITNQK